MPSNLKQQKTWNRILDFYLLFRLYGSYENLDAGQTYDALIDMSGNFQFDKLTKIFLKFKKILFY